MYGLSHVEMSQRRAPPRPEAALSASVNDGELILPREATRDLELMQVSVAWVKPQAVSRLVRALDERRQPELAHLKRVPFASPTETEKSTSKFSLVQAARPEARGAHAPASMWPTARIPTSIRPLH